MRILHVSEVSWGGVVSLIRQFADEQASRGHQVGLLAPSILPPVEHVEYREWSLNRTRPKTYPAAFRELRAAVAEFQPDVVHLHSFFAGFVGRLPKAVRSTPVVYQPHSWSFDFREDASFRAALKAWERFAGRRTQLLVTNCQDEIEEGHAAGVRTEGTAIGVAVDTDHFSQVDQAAKQRFREELGISSPRMLLCLGRLVRQKGQDLLVAAWERNPPADTELILVGPGDIESLQPLAPRQWGHTIKAVGEHSHVRPWLWAADAVLLPSRYEGTPVVVAEAMSSGRPVVSTNVNGVRELVVEGDLPAAGRVVALGDMDALLEECSRLLDDPSRAVEMSQAARIRAEALFKTSVVVDRLQAAYGEAIAADVGVPAQRSPSS